jgi:PII-like signaling protein
MQTNLTKNVPVYISVFNNPTYLENFIEQLENNGVKNIKIVECN